MKNGHKHKTGSFGNSAERYVSQLLMLHKYENGNKLPDLASSREMYPQAWMLEVKSGLKAKGVMVISQLHYEITTPEAFRQMFGEWPPEVQVKTDLFTDPLFIRPRFAGTGRIPLYYCVIDRNDMLRSTEIDKAYSTIKCSYGDMYIVPAEFAFHAFVAARAMRTKESDADIIRELRGKIRRDVLHWNPANYRNMREDPNSWQDLHGRDILSIFKDDRAFATKEGAARIGMISSNYDEFGSLRRILLPGPNGTSIYVLSQRQDADLFDSEVRLKVQDRIPTIERLSRVRSRARSLLDKLPVIKDPDLFDALIPGEEAKRLAAESLTPSQINLLDRCAKWLDRGESELEAYPVSY